jgi:hypothetical protein
MIGMAVMGSLVGVIILASEGDKIPDILPVVITSGMTGIIGLLVRPGTDAPPNP